jgi:uroporphyrinogen decarboxylase
MATWELPPETDDPPPRRIDAGTWEDKYGRVFKLSEATQDITCVRDPVLDAKVFTAGMYEKDPEPARRDPASWGILDAVVRRFKDEKYICGPSGGEVGIILLGGMERGLVELVDNPGAVRAATAFELRRQNLADEVLIHPDSDAVLWAGDYGHRTGPFVSPRMFREFFLDANKARARSVRERFGKRLVKHCCGNVWSYLDFFVEIGTDVYQAVQPTAGMDIGRVKDAYGDRLVLWGGVAVENLIAGTPDDVRNDVRRAMERAKPGGGFILGTSHSVAVGTRHDNYMAMLDEYRALRYY